MPERSDRLSHVDRSGKARMVDVGDKPMTRRVAIAEGRVRISEALGAAIRDDALAKGDVLTVARLAGVQAAKRTGALIPLCHPLGLDHVDVTCELINGAVLIRAEVSTTARTGVEMEALTAVSIAAVTVIDMGKAIDKAMVIEGVRIVEKHGGRSGSYVAEPER